MSFALDETTNLKLERVLENLTDEFGGAVDAQRIETILSDSVDRLASNSTVTEFVPLLSMRLARERLLAITRRRADGVANWGVVYVSLSGGGRGQIAAALTTHLSGGLVSVHSAGTASRGEVDPNVRAVIAEIGLDPQDAFARPITEEVLRATDVVVTMGHSVGVIEVPPHARRKDWRIGDPIGASLDEVRRVRGDIEHRVRALLDELGIEAA
jgi:arsenate reductase (thioredoxin)